jgi:hypothetical protein
MMIMLAQLLCSSEVVNKMFLQNIEYGEKVKFKHWAYDLSFKVPVVVSYFTFSLVLSIIVPISTVMNSFNFLIAYFLNKYHLLYIYPIDFESKVSNRKYLVTPTIAGLILFQFSVFLLASTVLPRHLAIYLFAFLVIQIMILFTTFEFIRKPWEGKELESERVLGQVGERMFESISSMHTGDFAFGGGMPVSINDSQLNFRRYGSTVSNHNFFVQNIP